MRLLVVEDQRELAQAIAEAFAKHNVHCDLAYSSVDAELMIRSTRYALIVLDLGLPDGDGLDLLRRLRAMQSREPTIILTARSTVESRIEGLTAGADDYLMKPFHFEELLARVHAVLRRDGGYADRLIEAGRLRLDIETRQFTIDGKPFAVSLRAGELLELLMRRLDRVVPKRVLEDQLFGSGDTLGSNAVEVYVHRIRRHLDAAGLSLSVQTVRGVGYMLMST